MVVNGLRHGRGVFTLKNGGRYEGGWVDDEMMGNGIYICKDSSTITGNWLNDKYNSQ